MITTLSFDCQLDVPRSLIAKIGLEPGSKVNVREENGHLVIEKAEVVTDALAQLRGSLDLGMSTDEFISEIRGD